MRNILQSIVQCNIYYISILISGLQKHRAKKAHILVCLGNGKFIKLNTVNRENPAAFVLFLKLATTLGNRNVVI